MANSFSADGLLYYPTIEFQDETWLKSALIFWDKIYRIVPSGYSPNDSYEVDIAKSEGLIEDINLSAEDLKNTADTFEEFCEGLSFFPSGFDASTYEVRLHSDKIDDRLKPFFRQFSESVDKQGFYKIPENIANGYMFSLSDTVSKRRELSKLTDDPDMFTAMTYFDVEGNFDEYLTDEEAKDIYTTLIIENLVPADVRSVSIKRLIDLNRDSSEYKNEFKKRVSEFNQKLSKCEDKEFATKLIQNFRKEITEVNTSYNEILKTYFNDLKSSLIYVGVPVASASILGSVFSSKSELFEVAYEIAKGITVGTVASITATGREVRKRWSSKKSNYYLELKKELTSSENARIKISNFSRRLDEFIND